MPNPYKNKVVYGNTVLIDITDTTAEAEDVAAGKYFYDKSGAKVEGTATGGGESIVVVETEDSHGGTVVEITGTVVKLQPKTVSPSSSQQIVSPDTGYTGLSRVTVNAVPEVQLQQKTTTPTESSQEITPDTGYDGLSKVTVGAISSTYVGSGVSKQAAKTVTPSKSSQQAVASGVYTTGEVTVAAIPAAYQDVTQVNAAAGDVASGKKIVNSSGTVVTGTLTFQTYYTGSSDPASSLGVNGDIYLKTT